MLKKTAKNTRNVAQSFNDRTMFESSITDNGSCRVTFFWVTRYVYLHCHMKQILFAKQDPTCWSLKMNTGKM